MFSIYTTGKKSTSRIWTVTIHQQWKTKPNGRRKKEYGWDFLEEEIQMSNNLYWNDAQPCNQGNSV